MESKRGKAFQKSMKRAKEVDKKVKSGRRIDTQRREKEGNSLDRVKEGFEPDKCPMGKIICNNGDETAISPHTTMEGRSRLRRQHQGAGGNSKWYPEVSSCPPCQPPRLQPVPGHGTHNWHQSTSGWHHKSTLCRLTHGQQSPVVRFALPVELAPCRAWAVVQGGSPASKRPAPSAHCRVGILHRIQGSTWDRKDNPGRIQGLGSHTVGKAGHGSLAQVSATAGSSKVGLKGHETYAQERAQPSREGLDGGRVAPAEVEVD